MKIYAIHDKDNQIKLPIGYLICYEKAKECIIELRDDLDEWDAPLLFQKYVREKIFTIPKDISMLWVEERVIPSGRQNIGSILREAKLMEYNEFSLLALSKGKCSQDNCYLEGIDYEDIPENIRKRSKQNVTECFPTEEHNIVCLFRDGLAQKISLKKLASDFTEISHILKNEALLRTVKTGIGGYSITFNHSIEIPVTALRNPQYAVPIHADDFKYFICNNIVDTSKACELLQCSRQNISYLVKSGRLEPVFVGTKENMFTLGSIERILTE